MPADELRRRLDGDIRAEIQRPLIERRREGVVHGEDRAGLAGRRPDRGEVGHRQERVGWRLEPHEIGRACGANPGRGVLEREPLDRPAVATLALEREPDHALVPVRRKDDPRRARQPGEHRRHGGHPRGERHGAALFEPTHDVFERLPRRCPVAARVPALTA